MEVKNKRPSGPYVYYMLPNQSFESFLSLNWNPRPLQSSLCVSSSQFTDQAFTMLINGGIGIILQTWQSMFWIKNMLLNHIIKNMMECINQEVIFYTVTTWYIPQIIDISCKIYYLHTWLESKNTHTFISRQLYSFPFTTK